MFFNVCKIFFSSTNPSEKAFKPVYAALALGVYSCTVLFPEVAIQNYSAR